MKIFLQFFVNKIRNTRLNIMPSTYMPSTYNPAVLSTCHVVFNQFTAISLSSLQKIVNKLNPTGSSLDVIPPRLVKHVLNLIGPNLLEFINKCLESGTVPDYLKHASLFNPFLISQI